MKKEYPNYRCAVEGILIKNGRAFICKRADNCSVKPGMWNVPAGKVKYTETPDSAIIREMREETKIDITKYNYERILERAFEGQDSDGNITYRLVFTYVIYVDDVAEPQLDEEHSEGKWITGEEVKDYEKMNKELSNEIERLALANEDYNRRCQMSKEN